MSQLGAGDALLLAGPVTLFHRPELLHESIRRLSGDGYTVVDMDCTGWDVRGMHSAFAAAFEFPDYYGGNLDALNDCLRDVVFAEPGQAGNRAAVVLRGFEGFYDRHEREATIVLDIVADLSREALVVGARLVCLIQTNNPRLNLPPIGAVQPSWTGPESS